MTRKISDTTQIEFLREYTLAQEYLFQGNREAASKIFERLDGIPEYLVFEDGNRDLLLEIDHQVKGESNQRKAILPEPKVKFKR